MTDISIRFLLNDEPVTLDDIDPNLTVLQYLREHQQLSGSKEGCASGDCGACTVVLAELDNDQLRYRSVNSCISFVGSLHGKQLITVEHLRQQGRLHDVQQAMVDNHGSQCGFCTPGFIMSAFALHKQTQEPSREQVVEALAGNLCRCTGYRSIIDAAMTASQTASDSFAEKADDTRQALKDMMRKNRNANLTNGVHHFYAPTHIDALADYLLKYSDAKLVAGGTDLALSVTQQLNSIERLVYVDNVADMKQIQQDDDSITIGAAVTYADFTELFGEHYPEWAQMIERIGSTQIRNVGTLGGNIGNASPIGDMPPVLIALGATMTLRRGNTERVIKVEDYFKDYKVTDLQESEFIQSVTIPKPQPGQQLKVYKISKRIDDDISTVLAAMLIKVENGKVVEFASGFGGMAAIPKRAVNCEQALLGKQWQQATIDAAKAALTQDFNPMTDVRASDKYRMSVSQNLLQKAFIEISQPAIETRVTSHA